MNLCSYGCGQLAHKQFKNSSFCCSEHLVQCPVIKEKNRRATKRIYEEKGAFFKYTIDEVFRENTNFSNEYLVHRILHSQLLPYKCSSCGLYEWLGRKLTLDLHHENGITTDNRLENLGFLCPNCHSLTDNYRGKNINGRKKVTDRDLIKALKNNKNIRQALFEVGLTPRGLNYSRAKKLSGRVV